MLMDTGSPGFGVALESNWDPSDHISPLVSKAAGIRPILCSDDLCAGKCQNPGEGFTCSPRGGLCARFEDGQDYCV
jgi:hypothetical protein